MPELFSLLLAVLRLNSASDLPCSLLARALHKCARTHTQAVPAAICCGLYAGEVYEDLRLDTCSDGEMLLQFALVLLEMPEHIAAKCLPRDIVLALQ
ncbi:jg26715, partial [Pararge aegeria aegeria]